MGPASLAAKVEIDVKELHGRTASERDELPYQKRLDALCELLFDEGGLSEVGHIETLDRIDQVLVENGASSGFPEYLDQLRSHRERVSDAHAKFARILDRTLSIQDILYVWLDRWPHLVTPVGLAFIPETEQELQAIRLQSGKPSDLLQQFFSTYYLALTAEGKVDMVNQIQPTVKSALAALVSEEDRATVYALFADQGRGDGRCYRVKVTLLPGTGSVDTDNDVREDMKRAARAATQYAFAISRFPRERYNVHWSIDESTTYEGASIGLAIAVGVLAELEKQTIDRYTAFTGIVSLEGGHVQRVDNISEKLRAARAAGMYRVFVPKENVPEAEAAKGLEELIIVGVESVDEAWSFLRSSEGSFSPDASLKARIRHYELECGRLGLHVTKEERDSFLRLVVTDYQTNIPVDIYQGKRGVSVKIGGRKDTSAYRAASSIWSTVFGPRPTPAGAAKRRPFMIREPGKRAEVAAALQDAGRFISRQEANCDYRLDFTDRGERVVVHQYASGTLLINQATAGVAGDPLFTDLCRRVEVALGIPALPGPSEPRSTTGLSAHVHVGDGVGADSSPSVASAVQGFDPPWIGTDESGKGDYFGPLVTAAVYVDDGILTQLASLGVRDSKLLTDQKAHALAASIRAVCAGSFEEFELPPETYNRLYEEFKREGKKLNDLLAWSHFRAVMNLREHVNCDKVITDQFANVRILESRLLANGRKQVLNLTQMYRAEVDLAVAAASILARDRFLTWLERTSQKYGTQLPKGASREVIQAAREVIARYGAEELRKIAKLHFKTTETVLGV